MANVGDKFVVEIGDIFEQDGETLYRIKGFKSLVFDENGLKKLVSLEEATNVNEVWELIKFLNNTKYEDIEKIFDVPNDANNPIGWILNSSVNNMLYKYKEWKKSENEINVGDVVKHKNGRIGVVTYKNDLILRGILDDSTTFDWFIVDCTKTGKHIEIKSVIQKIKE